MLSYEEKMHFLSRVRPERKDELLLRILRGEVVDITKDEDMFYQVNKERVTLDDFSNRKKYVAAAQDMKHQKAHIYDTKHGVSKGKKMRWLGDIPAEIYFSRPEFSPLIDKATRTKNIKRWLNSYPVFKAGDAQL